MELNDQIIQEYLYFGFGLRSSTCIVNYVWKLFYVVGSSNKYKLLNLHIHIRVNQISR